MLSLDSIQILTRGNPMGPAAVLQNLHTAQDTFTNVFTANDSLPALIGQMQYRPGERSARMTFLAPRSACETASLPALLESLAWQAGSRGAYNLLANLDELDSAFEGMRRAGFSVYAWQHIWRLPRAESKAEQPLRPGWWRPVNECDEIAIRGLYQLLVPPLVQSAEPLPAQRLQGLVHHQNGEVVAYIEGTYGTHGIYLNPIIHPSVEHIADLLRDLAEHLPDQFNRPVYLTMRSYQGWLQPALETINAQMAPRQALMVKHLAAQQRAPALNGRLAVLERRHAEPTAPMVHNISAADQDFSYPQLTEKR